MSNNFRIYQQDTGTFQTVTSANGTIGSLTSQNIKLIDPSHKSITFSAPTLSSSYNFVFPDLYLFYSSIMKSCSLKSFQNFS